MTTWTDVAQFLYGDVKSEDGFWYAHPLKEIEGLTDDQLFWVPDPKSLCMLWHVGHVAHRESTHISSILQAPQGTPVPPEFEVFGTEWCSPEQVRASAGRVTDVFAWIEQVRRHSRAYIASLSDEDYLRVLPSSDFGMGLSVAHWLFITVAHGALHLGRVQMMRAILEGQYDRPC